MKPGGLEIIDYNDDPGPDLESAWLIHGWLPLEGVSVFFGPSAVGKTFLMLDMAMHVATGGNWAGKKTEQGAVVYFAPESPQSIRNRQHAWRIEHNMTDDEIPLVTIRGHVSLYKNENSYNEMLEKLREVKGRYGDISMIVFDTLARSLGGAEENSNSDINQAFVTCDRILGEVPCAIVLVHHTGKDKNKGSRGGYALLANAYAEIEVKSKEELQLNKCKDEANGEKLNFRLKVYELGNDQHGKQVTSCVVTGLSQKQESVAVLNAMQQKMLELLKDKALTLDEWREVYYEIDPSSANATTQEMDSRKKRFQRNKQKLIKTGNVVQDGGKFQDATQGQTDTPIGGCPVPSPSVCPAYNVPGLVGHVQTVN